MVDELVSVSAPALPRIKLLPLFDMLSVPVPLSVMPDTPTINWVVPLLEPRLIDPLFAMLPLIVRLSPFTMFNESPELLRVSVPALPATFRFTAVELPPMVTALELVGTVPRLQLPAVPQLPSPAVPVHVSEVSFGVPPASAVTPAAAPASGRWLDIALFESFSFDPACAEANPSRLKTLESRQRTVIDSVTTREDVGRMGNSIEQDSVWKCHQNLISNELVFFER